MKREFLIIGSFAFYCFCAKAQAPVKEPIEKLKSTEIELVYNHYMQEGDHSAITGGTGTEELTVYGPSIHIKRKWGQQALAFQLGADIISSASTDNIDFVMSSASVLDARSYLNATYERNFEAQQLSVYGGMGFSIESDYMSIGSKLGLLKKTADGLRTYALQLQMFNDDLRWGRFSPSHYKPVRLIYPVELRDKEWLDEYHRNSFQLKVGMTQAINKRNVFGLYLDLGHQNGVLSTPFHRIYFDDGSLAVEQLPDQRWKAALALRLNSFVGGQLILKNNIEFAKDNFGIIGLTISNETAIKLDHQWTLAPNIRWHTQSESKYFKAYGLHDARDEYYTSDYDLSHVQTINIGMAFKFKPFRYLTKSMLFNAIILRYNYMYRSDGLSAHILSASFQMEIKKGQ